ncbi:hypothetical protein LCGC14_2628250 [marine sediment metagenome]|uniref:Uncharacterized protein n=1 Tax=marine sediment metagenome TaxID=412755 RepID=A0A0F9A116_9ZZZZ
MNFKKITVVGVLVLLLIPIMNTTAFSYIDYIKDGNYVFFLLDLEEDNYVEFNVTHEGEGNFTLFLFDERPTESNVKEDKSLNTEIFSNPSTVDYNLDDNPYINYTAQEDKIYYIEIILVGNGPDTFTISCTEDLTRYYLPIIPGFQIEFLLVTLTISIGLILILYKKRRKN